ncbi:hypothetical protein KY289_016694 [Solanum tuberosum]|nr:hypothetical protein KY289_016694 [Solanum tuberosum]
MLIEVDVTKPMPNEITVMDAQGHAFQQMVSYDWKPEYCEECLMVGHNCHKRRLKQQEQQQPKRQQPPLKKIWRPKETVIQEPGKIHEKVQAIPVQHLSETVEFTPVPTRGKQPSTSNPGSPTIKSYAQIISVKNGFEVLQSIVAVLAASSFPNEGDFNALLHNQDRLYGVLVTRAEIKDFADCVQDLFLNELLWKGEFYSWSNKHLGSDKIYSRLDMAIGNDEWMMQYGQLVVEYKLPHISYHSPMLLDMKLKPSNTQTPFRFFNVWARHEEFASIVQRSWSGNLPGDDKAPGVDGYNVIFYKKAWPIIKHDINEAKVIGSVISKTQAGFIPGRKGVDNIILTHELVHAYNRKNVSPRYMIKVDIQKAYDTVDWRYLEQVMAGLRFLKRFIDWEMQCVTTVSYSILINGELTKPFESARGLRQGDPMSPFLFAIVMEYLSINLNDLANHKQFKYHPKCSRLKITHLSFADDLLMFAKGDPESIHMLQEKFNVFIAASGLQANLSKSAMYFGGVSGANVITKRALVSWDKMCIPKSVGGLNLVNLKVWNKAAILKIYWDIEQKQDRLWIKWIHSYYIKGQSMEEVRVPAQACWMVRKILGTKEMLHILHNEVVGKKSMIRLAYKQMLGSFSKVEWRNLICCNSARPKAIFTLWLQAQNKLLTKDRMLKWKMQVEPVAPMDKSKLQQ